MDKRQIPFFCIPCIERLQAQCPHLHTSTRGGFHFYAGEVWDDIAEFCDDCNLNLDELPSPPSTFTQEEVLF